MKRFILASILTFIVGVGPFAAPPTPRVPDRIKDCPVGLVCFTIPQVTEMNLRIIELEKQISILQAKRHPLGACIGVGAGVGLQISDAQVQLDPSIGAYLIYGIRLPF